MKKLIISLFIIGLTTQLYAQIVELPEVEITAVNYKYLNTVDREDLAQPVKMLQEKVALYDLKKSDLYSDEYDSYYVTFYIPDGKIVAAYDTDGKIVRTIERFKDVKLPLNVSRAIVERFPGWSITGDVYKVSYHENGGVTKMQYKVRIENGDETLKLKIDEMGNFL